MGQLGPWRSAPEPPSSVLSVHGDHSHGEVALHDPSADDFIQIGVDQRTLQVGPYQDGHPACVGVFPAAVLNDSVPVDAFDEGDQSLISCFGQDDHVWFALEYQVHLLGGRDPAVPAADCQARRCFGLPAFPGSLGPVRGFSMNLVVMDLVGLMLVFRCVRVCVWSWL